MWNRLSPLQERILGSRNRLLLKVSQAELTSRLKSLGRLNISLIVLVICLLMLVMTLLSHSPSGNSSSKETVDNVAPADHPKARSKRSLEDLDGESTLTTYIRWGKTTCPSLTLKVYEGIAGGSWYSHPGGGSNYLCLPKDPIYDNYNAGPSSASGLVYGAEYEINGGNTFPFPTSNNGKLQDHNVPCVMCLTGGPVVMIPARNMCYPGWKMQYKGYLMTAHYAHANQKDFICMDLKPEADPAGFQNDNGALFYQVEGRCGSLPCPSYRSYWELTCVVCSLN